MSYLVSVVAIKQPDNTYKCLKIGGFDGMYWHMSNKEPRKIQRLNSNIIKLMDEDSYNLLITNKERLLSAPLDEVILITGQSTYESMSGRTPLDNRKGLIDLDTFLINKPL